MYKYKQFQKKSKDIFKKLIIIVFKKNCFKKLITKFRWDGSDVLFRQLRSFVLTY